MQERQLTVCVAASVTKSILNMQLILAGVIAQYNEKQQLNTPKANVLENALEVPLH